MAAVLMSVAVLLPARAPAAGMITHAWMADEAINHVTDPDLKNFLVLHNFELLSGASFPDGGYFPGANYGEISHWERFVDGYVRYLRERPGCGDLADPLGPCAPLVAHMLGTAAHGMGDEMWDWMFEPLVADHGEIPDHPLAPPELGDVINNIEYAMDTIALADHFRWGESGFFVPPPTELTPIYAAIGYPEVTEAHLLLGHAGGSAALAAERAGGVADSERVREQMPWSSAHMDDESGGVFDTSEGVAGYMDALWSKLLDETPPPPRVVSVHPEDGETGVPYVFQPPKTSPGPHTGGGELRIIAVLSNAVDSSTVTAENFKLLGPGGEVVRTTRGEASSAHEREARAAAAGEIPVLGGFPRPGPYGNGDGTHSIMTYPAVNLEPCTTYTAVATTGITDWAELPINTGMALDEETRWSFTTRSADGEPCPAVTPAVPKCEGVDATVYATAGGSGQQLAGTPARDVIVGTAGDDLIHGGAGDDLICVGAGDDIAAGGAGADEIHGGNGEDELRGGAGNDEIRGHRDRDRVAGGAGADFLHAGADDDTARGNSGDDRIRGKSGNDRVHGGSGADSCNGGTGDRDRVAGCELRTGFP